MNKVFNYIFVVIIFSFVFVMDINAECSYQERKELLNEAKNVEAFFEADVDNNKFVFYLYNLTDNLFVRLENTNTNQYIEIYKYMYEADFYTKDESNTSDAINYKLNIYSNKSGCYGNIITTKKINKGVINKFFKEEICKGIEDYKYCLPVLNNKILLSNEEVYNEIKKYKESISYSENDFVEDTFGIDDLINLISEYWYGLIIIFIIIAIIFVIRYINKKRGELK